MSRRPSRSLREAILADYDRCAPLYEAYARELQALISRMLSEHGISVHSVSCRLKDRGSLAEKLSREGAIYRTLSDVTDICGVRVITYFEDAVDRIGQVLNSEFQVDGTKSIDKRSALNPDQFGYLSLHHVLELSPERSALVEYRRFAGLKAEVQTRSILQHAWAEIEHDLGYRTGADVPRDVRRRFARLAGLLELADEEFTEIRDSLREYERTVSDRISDEPATVGLDQASIAAFVEGSPLVKRLDNAFVAMSNARLRTAVDPGFFEGDAERFASVGISSIAELEEALQRNADLVLAFARVWLQGNDHVRFSRGIILFYLWYVLVAQKLSPTEISKAIRAANLGPDPADDIAAEIRTTFQTAAAELGLAVPPLPMDKEVLDSANDSNVA